VIAVGIDPGLDGAVAVLGGREPQLYRTPVLAAPGGGKRSFDLPAMRELLVRAAPDMVVIERVGPMPKQGVTSMFNFGCGFGMWLGLLAGLQIPHELVPPKAWKKAVLAGTTGDKRAAVEYCQRMFPGLSLLATPRSKVPHDGFSDSLCMAVYARKLANDRR